MGSHGLGESQANHVQRMKNIDLRIQYERLYWMELIEGDDHRLTKAVSHLFDQRRDGFLILPWNKTRHLLSAFGSSMTGRSGWTSMNELTQATKAYYSTVERFPTSDPLLSNLRCVAGHIERERSMYVFRSRDILREKNVEACGATLMNGH